MRKRESEKERSWGRGGGGEGGGVTCRGEDEREGRREADEERKRG